ncbi:MAG: FHA domain-containing protein [Planctomycetota bacterium]
MSSAEKLSDFIAQTQHLADEEAFVAEHPYPFLVREATKGRVPLPQPGRGTKRLERQAALPTVGDGFMEGEVWIHRVFPRDPEGETVKIGRDEGCDLHVGDGSISAVHAEFSIDFSADEKRFFVRDNQSANGTFVNGDRLDVGAQEELEDMDSIRLGPVVKLQFFTAPGFFQFLSMYRRIKKP